MEKLRIRNNQQHKIVVDKKYFRAYYSGAYALWELDFGRTGHSEVVVLLGCIDRIAKILYHKPMVPKKEKWSNGIAY